MDTYKIKINPGKAQALKNYLWGHYIDFTILLNPYFITFIATLNPFQLEKLKKRFSYLEFI